VLDIVSLGSGGSMVAELIKILQFVTIARVGVGTLVPQMIAKWNMRK
jgi:hypothetical protein